MTIALKIGENEYDGWSSGLISSTLLDLSDRFILSGTNIFTSQQVKAGDLMVLEVGGDPVITGYGDLIVDTRGNLTVEGRDKTGDLVDSMAAGATSFIKQSVLSIIQGLSTPFNVEAAGDSGPTLEQFTISPDETVAQAILRLVSNYGIIVTSDKDGNLVVTEGGNFSNPGISVREGVNIEVATAEFRDSARHTETKALGQNYLNPSLFATANGTAKRPRPFGYILNGEANLSDCQLAADRLRNYSEGRACRIIVSITTLDYYPAGTLVSVDIPSMGINDDMLIETVNLEFDTETESGSVTFELVPPQKYGGEPITCPFLL